MRATRSASFSELSLPRRRSTMMGKLKGVGRSLAVWPFAPQALLAFFQLTFQADPRVLLRGARVVGRGLS